MTTDRPAPWIYEHGEQYDIPTTITQAEGIEDLSWHNDACPSFGRYVEGPTGDSHDLRIWCEHPDEDQRETGCARFFVGYQPWSNEPVPELEQFADGAPIYEGDDAAEALAIFMAALAKVHAWVRGGASA